MANVKENQFKILLKKTLCNIPIAFLYPLSFLLMRYISPLSMGIIKYLKFCKFLEESQWWPRWKLEQYQTEKLKQLLRHAYTNVPYYTEVFKKLNLNPNDIKSIKDLKKIPILTKEGVAKNFDKLIAKGIRKKYLKLICTSGSTGKPMQFYLDKHNDSLEYAFYKRHFDWMAVKIYNKRIKLWSRPFIEREIKDIYFYEPWLQKLSLSTTPHPVNDLNRYIELINQFNPLVIMGNPSFLFLLACYAQEKNIHTDKFKCFISLFENLLPYQREFIKNQFNCEIFNCYECEERIICAVECSKHEGMHIEMERGILEIIGEDGEILPEGEIGRIIATGLHNYAMPLIRYDIGDIGSVLENLCSCGRGLPLLNSLEGRSNEVLKYKNKYIYSTTLSVLLRKFKNIKECQFVQTSDELKLNIVKRKDYTGRDTQELIKTLRKMIDDKLKINIEFIEYIPRTKMGKFSLIVSSIN